LDCDCDCDWFIMFTSLGRSARRVVQQLQRTQKRSFSSHGATPEQLENEMHAAKKWTYLTVPILAVIIGTAWIDHSKHGHHEQEVYPYLRIRTKQYFLGFYECQDCNYLDFECRKKCKQALFDAEQAKQLAEEHEKDADKMAVVAPKH